MYSKLYEQAKAQHEKSEDYEIAEIAKENSKLKGQVAGALAGLAIGAISKKKLKGLLDRHPGIVRRLDNFDPGITEALTSNLTTIPAAIAGYNYGGEVTGNAAKMKVLKEIEEEKERNKSKGRKRDV